MAMQYVHGYEHSGSELVPVQPHHYPEPGGCQAMPECNAFFTRHRKKAPSSTY